jgi:superfamily II DNA or RNA helicase
MRLVRELLTEERDEMDTVVISVTNVWSRIGGLRDLAIVDSLDKMTSYHVGGYQYTRAFREGYYDKKTGKFMHWDGKRHLLTQRMVFPTGLLQRVCDFLTFHDVPFSIEDKRIEWERGQELPLHDFVPRYYQTEAVEEAIKQGRGIIRIGTGGGKTGTSAMIVAKYNIPSMTYVIGKDLLYQFHAELSKILGMQVGIIGDGVCEIHKHNVCSVWTAAKAFDLVTSVSLDDEDWAPEAADIGSEDKRRIKKTIEGVGLAIFDEAHFLATDTLQAIFKVGKKCRFLFGLSGTDWRDDGADLLLESVCGKRIYNMPSSRLIKEGYLVQPKMVMVEVPPPAQELPQHYATVYSEYIVKNDVRNSLVEDAARKLIARGRRVLILVRYLSHGRHLVERLSDIPLYFVNGDVDGQTRKEVRQAFEEGTLKCLIASSVFDIGVDIPTLDALILAGSGKSTVRCLQRIGRVLRKAPAKKNAIVVDFLDNARYLDKHSATRVAVYESEPEFIVSFPKGFDSSSLKRPKKISQKIQ